MSQNDEGASARASASPRKQDKQQRPHNNTRPRPAARIPTETLDAMRLEILTVVSGFVPLKRSGVSHVGLCPFHVERTPSFSVRPNIGVFHCFGCGAGGDVFDFLMLTDTITFPVAVRRVAAILNMPMADDLSTEAAREVRRRQLVREGAALWREAEIRRVAEELRNRDLLVGFARQIHAAEGYDAELREAEAWNMLEAAYDGYSLLEWNFERLLSREVPTAELHRESAA